MYQESYYINITKYFLIILNIKEYYIVIRNYKEKSDVDYQPWRDSDQICYRDKKPRWDYIVLSKYLLFLFSSYFIVRKPCILYVSDYIIHF